MRIYFGTNREPDSHTKPTRFTGRLNTRTPGELRFGYAEVEADLKSFTIKVNEETIVQDKDSNRSVVAAKRDLFDDIRKIMLEDDQRDALVFVHGFNYSFDEAILGMAQIINIYETKGAKLVPILFTWPSDGKMIPFRSYYSDRDDARSSALALSRGFEKLAHFMGKIVKEAQAQARAKKDPRTLLCNRQIHVLAHSMGTYALSNAVKRIADENSRIWRLWGEVILAAADEDENVFEQGQRFERLAEFCQRVSIYINRQDRALAISRTTKGNPQRLGAHGPRNPRGLPPQIEIIDCSDVVDGESTEHQYYQSEPLVVTDIVSVLKSEAGDLIPGRRYNPQKNQYSLGVTVPGR